MADFLEALAGGLPFLATVGATSPFIGLFGTVVGIYRALIALQTADAFGVATPADWRPGDDVIIGPAGSCGAAKNRMDGKEDMVCQDWFFCSRKLDKEKVLSTVLKKS